MQRIAHPVTLPSRGKFYTNCPEGEVGIYPWTTAQEEMIIKYGETRPEQMIDMICSSSVELPAGMEYGDLLMTDKHFLLLQMRALSFFPEFTVENKCQSCSTRYSHTVNLNTDLKVLVPTPEDPLEPIPVTLIHGGVDLGLRYLRVKDSIAQDEYLKKIEGTPQAQEGSPAFRFKRARQIVTINGQEATWEEKQNLIANMSMLDSNLIQDTINQYETGIDSTVTMKCSACGVEEERSLSLTQGFFRPSRVDMDTAQRVAKEARVGN